MSEPTAQLSSAFPRSIPLNKRRHMRYMLIVAIVFCCGLLTGVVLTVAAIRQGTLNRLHHPEEISVRVAQKINRVIGLRNDQAARIQAVLRRRQRALRAIRVEWQPAFERELQLVRTEVGEVLDDEQRRRWETMFDEFQRIWIPQLLPLPAASREPTEQKRDADTAEHDSIRKAS